jgi:hypothetical protein
MTTTFARTTNRGTELDLAAPLPESLAELVPEEAEAHAKLASRLRELRAEQVELTRKLADAIATDERAAMEAAAKDKPAPPSKAEPLRAKLEAADAEVARYEAALESSADALLTSAVPHVAAGAERARERAAAGLKRLGEVVQAVTVTVEDVQRAEAELGWLNGLLGAPAHVAPFRAALGAGELAHFKNTVQASYRELAYRREEQRAEIERHRRYEAEQAAEEERHRERGERDDAERAVRYEGMRLTHRGGRPVDREPEEAAE